MASSPSPLNTLIDAKAIPGDIEFIESGVQAAIDTLLSKVFYKDLIVHVSPDGDEAAYSVTLVTAAIRQELFGTGMELVFFKGSEAALSEFPIIFNWHWGIKRYLAGFESDGFSYAPDAFIEIFFELAGIEDFSEVSEAIIDIFLDDGTDFYLAFYDELKTMIEGYKTGQPAVDAEIDNILAQLLSIRNEVSRSIGVSSLLSIRGLFDSYENNTVMGPAVLAIEASLTTLGQDLDVNIDIYPAFVTSILGTFGDIDDKFDSLVKLFNTWLADITIEDVKDLLIPQFYLELAAIAMAIEFPRDLLLPMKLQAGHWQVDPDTSVKAGINFNAGRVSLDSKKGFQIDIDQTIPMQLPRCMIPNLGVQLEFVDVKLDLSRKYNIAEAVADGRPEDFIGAYIGHANIFLPEEWFEFDEDGSTLQLFAKNLLVGTGGLSGTIGLAGAAGTEQPLQAAMPLTDGRTANINPGADGIFGEGDSLTIGGSAPEDDRYVLAGGGTLVTEGGIIKRYLPSDGELSYKLGKNGGSGQWEIGFKQFYINFHQNKIQESEITGFLTIPNFKQEGKTGPLRLDVAVFFENDGDFRVTASTPDGLTICLGEDGAVFKVKLKSVEAGKDDEKLYLEVSGDLDFSNNNILKDIITKPIEVKKLRIYSDGTFEIEGGSIPIPGSVNMKLGPVEVDITNITLGGEVLDKGNYKFIGFDCGVSTGSAGLDMRGDGIKLYFNHDGSDIFLRISGIGIDLIIPGTADEATAALILKGYLSIKEDEYTGAVAFSLPKVRLAGGAAMKMKPKIPAFAVDAFLDLPAPIPLGPTGLGIYGFRGLFGLRYIADLPVGAVSDPEAMFGFYTKKVGNPLNGNTLERGLHLGKITTPDQAADQNRDSDSPISIGAGATLGTVADSGRAFSMQAFLFLSIPDFLMLSGRANVLGERVAIVSETEPPFFAYLAITSEYVSIGMGAEYKIRADDGAIVEFKAEAKMAFFFNDSSAWYINFGTKEQPNSAKILKKVFNLDAYAYLMISASGIEAGAGIKFDLKRSYGPVKVAVSAYGDVYAMLSFRKPQAGGGIACGGNISAKVFGVGFNLSLDAYIVLTVPKPYLVKGGVRCCLEVDLWLTTWRKCFNIEFKWEFDQNNDLTPIKAIDLDQMPLLPPVSGFHRGSQSTYPLAFAGGSLPALTSTSIKTVPLDTFIDIQFKKPIDPNAVLAKIGGVTNPPVNNVELVPPKDAEKQVTHRFEAVDVNIKVYNRNTNAWQDYNPYRALDAGSFLQAVNPDDLKLGAWQKKGTEYNSLRMLADTPFSFADNMAGGFTPEQMGVTAGTLFCEGTVKESHCVRWKRPDRYEKNRWYTYETIKYKSARFDAEALAFGNVFHIPFSLCINNRSRFEAILPERSLRVSLKLTTYAQYVNVYFYDLRDVECIQNGMPKTRQEYVLIKELSLSSTDLLLPVIYDDSKQTIKKVAIEALMPDQRTVKVLENRLHDLANAKLEGNRDVDGQIRELQAQLAKLNDMICSGREKRPDDKELNALIKALEKELATLVKQAANIKSEARTQCKLAAELKEFLDRLRRDRTVAVSDAPMAHATLSSDFAELQKEMDLTVRKLRDKNRDLLENAVLKFEDKLDQRFNAVAAECKSLARCYSEIVKQIADLETKIGRLQGLLKDDPKPDTNRCSTYIHEICYLTESDWFYNQSIPPKEAIEADYETMADAISKVIAPIWRPDETYAIEVKARETINGAPNDQNYYFAFKTAGPLGHFPLGNLPDSLKTQYGLDASGDPPAGDSKFDKTLEIPETSLKSYIDGLRSYPDPRGNILNQKPLFYKNASITLFYTEPYVYHFFNDWPNYGGLGKRFASMKIDIVDPSKDINPVPSTPTPVLTTPPSSEVSWKKDINATASIGLETINNLREPTIKNPDFHGETCWQTGGEPIKPASKSTEITVSDLRPSKLYNVVVSCRYSKTGAVYKEKQVHSYPFQTSRYGDFDEQINSYRVTEYDFATGDQRAARDAIFDLGLALNELGVTLSDLTNVATGADETGDLRPDLISNYPDPFQRLVLGYLKHEPLNPTEHTEINRVRNEGDGSLIGLWVRNPEPFNDPRIPAADMQSTVKLLINGSVASTTKTLFSKDNCEFIILHDQLALAGSVNLRFSFLVWEGTGYIEKHSLTTDNLI